VIGEVVRLPDVERLQQAAAELFVAAAADAVRARGVFTVVLSGGTTPKGVYARLAEDDALRRQVHWEHVLFFWGDERHVAPDHPDSNFRMAEEAMLGRLPIDPNHVYRIKGEYEDAARAADAYERDLRGIVGARYTEDDGALPCFDLVLLGMGADGHTASLFPGSPALHEQRRLVVANPVPKLKTERITMTPPVLNNASEVVFLVHGADKADALQAVLEAPSDPDRLPAQLIRPRQGRLRWLVDPTAAARLAATL
jgi:6-phosphogluconolactonase